MASELRVNTLKDAAGANSVAMEYVAGGSAKAWARSGSAAINESLNTSGFTDNGTGDYTIAFSSAFSTNTFAGTTSGLGTAARSVNYSNSQTTSIDLDTFASTTGSRTDTATGFQINGDLA
jgi:hypothetical protein